MFRVSAWRVRLSQANRFGHGVTVFCLIRFVSGSLRRERIFRDQSDLLAFSDDILCERCRCSAEGTRYICKLVDAYVTNATRWSRALTVTQTVCITLRSFATGTYMHSVFDAENLSKNAACCAICKVVLALTKLLNMFVVFPGHVSRAWKKPSAKSQVS